MEEGKVFSHHDLLSILIAHMMMIKTLLVKCYFKKGTQRINYKPHNAPQLWDLHCLNNDLLLSFFYAK
jgi:hypothetical protein